MKNTFLILFTVMLFSSCSSTKKIEALRPDADNATPLVYDAAPSYIGLPISIKLKDIAAQANKYVVGLVYEDTNIEDDNVMLRVWKQAPIEVAEENGKLKTVLPLKVWVKVRYGKTVLGVDLYDTREINLNGVVNLLSDISLYNWKIKTNTTLKNIDWVESPSITVAGKSIPITYLINPAIKLFKNDIEKAIDDAIQKSVDFKPEVIKALEQISAPIEVNKDFQTWFQLLPQELYATESQLTKSEITIDMGLKADIETYIGKKPENKFNKDKIVLKTVSKMPDKIAANIVAISNYTDASVLINNNFKGQVFGDEKRKITVQQVNLWHKNGKIILALDVIGSINGTIYLNGVPKYNKEKQEIYFDELDYVLDTKSKLLKTANWLAQGLILKKINENCRYSIAENLKEAEKSIKPYISNYAPMKGVFINGNLSSVSFNKIQLTNTAFVAFMSINGNIKVSVDGLE